MNKPKKAPKNAPYCAHIITYSDERPPVRVDAIGDWAATATGGFFFPLDPLPNSIRVEDLISASARIGRFNGHIRPDWPADIYSVGQHSLLVLNAVRDAGGSFEEQRQALLHDMPEVYIHDVIAPMKKFLPNYRAIESHWEAAFESRFGVSLSPLSEIVSHMDMRALVTEKRQVCHPRSPIWSCESHHAPLDCAIWPRLARAVMDDLTREFDALHIV